MKLGSPKSPRQTVAFLHDLGMAAAAFMIALLLRLGDEAWRSLMTELWPPMLLRSEEHTSELQSLMRISYAVFCLKKKTLEHVMCSQLCIRFYLDQTIKQHNNTT